MELAKMLMSLVTSENNVWFMPSYYHPEIARTCDQ